jgi:alkyl sulfatase BDS1-like metallo-beta-lactamase superfamily hydrolase
VTINVTFTDLDRTFVLELANAVLHHKEGKPASDADASVRLTRAFWLQFLGRQTGLKELVFSNELDIDGNRLALLSLLGLLQPPEAEVAIVTPE